MIQEKEDDLSVDTDSEADTESTEDTDEEHAELESWTSWLSRTTRQVEEVCKKLNLDDWVTLHRERKWGLAGHTARREDKRWSTTILNWSPDGHRDQRRPNRRWTDDLDDFSTKELDCP